jgi:hypothetical protein
MVVDGAGTYYHQQAVIATMQHIANLLAALLYAGEYRF